MLAVLECQRGEPGPSARADGVKSGDPSGRHPCCLSFVIAAIAIADDHRTEIRGIQGVNAQKGTGLVAWQISPHSLAACR